jgi:hypothetical protein
MTFHKIKVKNYKIDCTAIKRVVVMMLDYKSVIPLEMDNKMNTMPEVKSFCDAVRLRKTDKIGVQGQNKWLVEVSRSQMSIEGVFRNDMSKFMAIDKCLLNFSKVLVGSS